MENNLQTEEINLTQQQPSVIVDKTPSKRSLAHRARREKERQIAMMDAIINNTYSTTNMGINEENSFIVATSKCALTQRENYDNCGVAPSEILGIDETSNTSTRLRNRIVETGESSRGPIDISRTDRRRYNLPSIDEIAIILPGDGQEAPSTRNIINIQQALPPRDRDQVPETSWISVWERLGPQGATSKAISKPIRNEPQPSIYLGGEIQYEISRGHQCSIHQEEEQRPPPRVPVRDHLSEGTGTHNPQPLCQAAQPIYHYVTQEHMDQRIKELIEAQVLGTTDDLTKLQGSPFVKELFDMDILKGLYFNLNQILCRLFTTSLQEEPLRWFYSLPEDSICTFEQLQIQFIKTYAHKGDKEENQYFLISLKKSNGEKLEAFAKKFLELTHKVDNFDQKTAIAVFTNALQVDCKAKEYLFLSKPATLEDMITKVNGYVDLEGMITKRHKSTKFVLTTNGPSTDRITEPKEGWAGQQCVKGNTSNPWRGGL
ncbi:hypothetical protein GIB67_029605 [Kingdonia uniflora]|uniref:Retrotransposon gag domain-containing protein n=1 Tax=Kingdonia uniflora TaxID=39325 RepID=A0A7J7LLA7_9MAGN|nr:hypothetical protein GIB67_029605 [Kingdonia uniflora]